MYTWMKRVFAIAGLFAAMCLAPTDARATQFFAQVKQLHSPDAGRNCVFFTLQGVIEADPAVPGNGWFAVSMTHNGYREIVALLTAAKLSGAQISLTTTGRLVCGYAEVNHVEIL